MTLETKMNLEDFAKQAGCVVSPDIRKEAVWKYQVRGDTRVTYTGFRTEMVAYRRFLEGKFGKSGVKAIESLLKKVERLESSNKELRRKL